MVVSFPNGRSEAIARSVRGTAFRTARIDRAPAGGNYFADPQAPFLEKSSDGRGEPWNPEKRSAGNPDAGVFLRRGMNYVSHVIFQPDIPR
jgi:hypothetical protein